MKPAYRVMTMAEVRALPWNGFKVASTFAGTGGSSTGYRMAGFKVVYASEFVESARDSYRLNADPSTVIDDRDIRQVTGSDILTRLGLAPGELDVLDGSPPCASFSMSGNREKDWGKEKPYSETKQRTDDLFFEFARLVGEIQPKVFVAENVSGLVKGVAKGKFIQILTRLKSEGYKVAARTLDAQWLGVPQTRARVIFVGVRSDLGLEPVHPKPLPHRYTLRDALPWIEKAVHDTGGRPEFSQGDFTDKPCPAITVGSHGSNARHYQAHGPEVEPEAWMKGKAMGQEWSSLPVGGQSEKYFQLVRSDPDKPIGTLTTVSSGAGVSHPHECRKFSIAELKRLCGFPDDFQLAGKYSQQYERLGRAVPPVMMMHVAATIRDEILCKTN